MAEADADNVQPAGETPASREGKMPSPRPMFSVIMPCYNHASYVGEAIRSVIAQTWKDWQLIIVDDGSSDDSQKIIEEIGRTDGRISWRFQPNAGPAAARNAAIAMSAAPWVAYLDSDDLWLSETLANYAAFIEANPQTQLVYGYRNRLNEDGQIVELPPRFQDRQTGTRELFRRMYLSQLCVCHRRELLSAEKAGPWDATLRVCEDYDLYLRMSLHCQFDFMGKPTGLRRRHGANLSRRTGWSRFTEAEILRRFVEKRGGAELLDSKAISCRLGKLYSSAASAYFAQGLYGHSSVAAGEALQYKFRLKPFINKLLSTLLCPLSRLDRPLPRLG